jgi:23S rRNA C2498 (ribose-2'-O)-methylase RlmM
VELIIKKSFLRDWDNIGSKDLNRAIGDLVRRISHAHSITEISRMKHLRNRANRYKIEIRVQSKIYWIVCDVLNNKMRFVRIKSESWCKKNL